MTFRELISTLLDDGRAKSVLFTLTPPAVRERTLALRLVYAGGVLATFGLSLLSASASAMLLLLSIGVIYYLMSQVLGLKVDFDPTVLIHPIQRDQSAPSAPN
jgi:hypothetical protein